MEKMNFRCEISIDQKFIQKKYVYKTELLAEKPDGFSVGLYHLKNV